MAARRAQIPLTVHVAIGTDIVHMTPALDGAALGKAALEDFRLLSAVVVAHGTEEFGSILAVRSSCPRCS